MILDQLFAGKTTAQTPQDSLQSPSDALITTLVGTNKTASGKVVSSESALRVTTVYACVRILSETIAALPFNLYRRIDNNGNREIARNSALNRIIHDLPNSEMTAMDFRMYQMVCLLLRGNAFAEVYRARSGEIGEIIPLNPDHVMMDRDKSSGKLIFEQHNSGIRRIVNDRMWRVSGMSLNGLIGLSPIACAREGIGMSLALEEHGARLFSNGAKPGGILEHPGKLNDTTKKQLIDSWNAAYQGVGNSQKVAVLQEGMKWHQLGMSAEDAQFLESRKYQRSEIAALYGVPLHMLGDLDKATFSNIEHQSIMLVVYTLLPWLKRFEQSIYRDLLTPTERQQYFAEHRVDGLLRGDAKARSEFYKSLFSVGALSINDIRRLENENSIEGGDKHYLQMQQVPIEQLGKPTP